MFSHLFNYVFAVGAFGFGNVLAFAAPGEPCAGALHPAWQMAFTISTTFIFPVFLVILRWKIKDRSTRKFLDKITGSNEEKTKEEK